MDIIFYRKTKAPKVTVSLIKLFHIQYMMANNIRFGLDSIK